MAENERIPSLNDNKYKQDTEHKRKSQDFGKREEINLSDLQETERENIPGISGNKRILKLK